jgi:hypothetical protein
MTNKPTSLRLSQEELLFLVRLLNLPDLPGIGDKPWGEIDLDSAQRAYQAAGRGLLARNLTSINEDGDIISVDDSIKEVLTVSAYPDKMAAMQLDISEDLSDEIYYYNSADISIRHSFDEFKIHSFESHKNTDMGFSEINRLMSFVKWDFASNIFEINQELFEQALQAAQTSKEECVKILEESGLDNSSIDHLSVVLANTEISIYLQLIYKLNPEIDQNKISFMWNFDSCWFMEYPVQAGEPIVRIRAIDHTQLKKISKTSFHHFH